MRVIYEKLGMDGILIPNHTQEIIQCYLKLGEPYTALNYINSLTKDEPEMMSVLSEVRRQKGINFFSFNQSITKLIFFFFLGNDRVFNKIGRLFATR